ncbi:PerC family transcriptional regulator [Enterobacteriaceae bacterium 89]|nr:PerC family transcriptional regulator [Enterobacteriaceae bacterium 89]
MTKEKLNQREQVAIVVRHIPGCVLQDICEALDMTSSSAGNFLRALTNQGVIIRQHNGTQYVYTVAPGAEIPEADLPFMNQKRADPEKLRAADIGAKKLESRGLWRRAATAYTAILELAGNANEVLQISKRRDACLRKARRA